MKDETMLQGYVYEEYYLEARSTWQARFRGSRTCYVWFLSHWSSLQSRGSILCFKIKCFLVTIHVTFQFLILICLFSNVYFKNKCFAPRIRYQIQLLEALLGAERHYSKVKSNLGEKHKKQVADGKDGMILAKINQCSSSLSTGKAHGRPENAICSRCFFGAYN